jgi:hypothetical protein
MSGNTGKMTAEALSARGPRMALARLANGKLQIFDSEYRVPAGASIIARSYTWSYLKKIQKFQG